MEDSAVIRENLACCGPQQAMQGYGVASSIGEASINVLPVFEESFETRDSAMKSKTRMDRLIRKYKPTKKVAIMGSNATAIRFSHFVQKQTNLDFYGFVGTDECIYSNETGFVSQTVYGRLAEAARYGVKEVYVAVAPQRMSDVGPLIIASEQLCVRLKFVPDLGGPMGSSYYMSYMGNEFPVISLRNEPLENIRNRFTKRVFDLIFSSMVIVFVLSWLYPIIALLIKFESRGPVLFKQLRSGRNDESFWCYKFRSMRVNHASDVKQATKGDDRITQIGKFLRRTSLDELPQFFNVLLGHMSVIGPRPHMLKHTEEYKAIISQFMVRHFMKPGITGWAQVNGFRGETKEKKDMENRVKYDIFYLENWSAMLDVKIVFMTILNALKGEENAF